MEVDSGRSPGHVARRQPASPTISLSEAIHEGRRSVLRVLADHGASRRWIVESLCGKENASGRINSIDVPGFDVYGDKRNLFADLPQGIAAGLASHKPGFCKLEAHHRVVERPAPKLGARRSVLDHHNRTSEVRDNRRICMSQASP